MTSILNKFHLSTKAFLSLVCLLALDTTVVASSVNMSWTANTEPDLAGYKVYYGTTSRAYGTPINVGIVTSYTLPGLTAGTYYFAVTAYDTSGNESAYSNEASLTVPLDTVPPVISAVGSSSPTSTGATISWTTNEASDSQVEYGTTTAYGSSTALISSLVTNHPVMLSGLQASKLYHYRVKSKDAAGNLATSGDFTFSTLAMVSGLVTAYSMDEGSGTALNDVSGNLNNGVLTNGTAWVAGKYGNGLSFDGINDYVSIANSASLDLSGKNLTIEFWANVQSGGSTADHAIISKPWVTNQMNSPYYQYGVEFQGNQQFVFLIGTVSGVHSFGMQGSYGAWHHIAFSYDGSNVRGYLDGVQKFATAETSSLTARGTNLILGVDAVLSQAFKGSLDDLRIYNRTLSQTEIQTDMNTGVGGAALTKCDCNSDGATNALDLQAEINAILANNTSASYDTNRDGSVNVLDLQVLGNVILGVTTCP